MGTMCRLVRGMERLGRVVSVDILVLGLRTSQIIVDDGESADYVLLCIDDPEIYDGACVGVQLVGGRLEGEKMLVLAVYIGDAVTAVVGDGRDSRSVL